MRNRKTLPLSKSAGFTLVEILVTISIIIVIGGISLSTLNAARDRANRVVGVSNLRQIGMGLSQCLADRNQTFPGPMWPGQVPQLDPKRSGRLVRELAPYFALPERTEPWVVPLFVSPAYLRAKPKGVTLENCRTFVLNMQVSNAEEIPINPWGSLVEGSQMPMRFNVIANPSTAWAISDADRLHPSVAGASWRTSTPEKPIYGNVRMAVFFDGHVSSLPLSDFESISK